MIKKVKILLSVLLILLFIISPYIKNVWIEIFELKTLDLRYKIRGTDKIESDVVVVAIDEESIINMEAGENNDSWPWERRHFGQLVKKLFENGAKTIGFDISFTSPDEKDERNDTYFASVLRRYPKVILGSYIIVDSSIFTKYPEEYSRYLLQNTRYLDHSLKIMNIENVNKTSLFRVYKIVPAIKEFSELVPVTSYEIGALDVDGIVRNMPLFFNEVWAEENGFGLTLIPHMDVMLYAQFIDAQDIIVDFKDSSLNIFDKKIPFDNYGRFQIYYYGKGREVFKQISFYDIMNDNFDSKDINNKVVIVGYTDTAKGLYDLRVTPFSTEEAGVYIHANAVQNFIRNEVLERPGFIWRILYLVICMVISLLLLAFTNPYRKLIAFVVPLFVIIFSYITFTSRIWLDMFFPLLSTVIIISTDTVFAFLSEYREKKKIKGFFYKYVPDTVAKEIIKSSNLNLGGKVYNAVILFSDIQGFTEKSEKMNAEGVISFLNEYLTAMADVIRNRYNGTIDKFIGDAIMSIFGAPVTYGDEVSRALNCALDMKEELKKLNQKLNLPFELKNGIGIHFGEVVIGNVGAPFRMDYTAIGDTVNTSSRVEHLTRDLNQEILVTETVYEMAEDTFIFEAMGDFSVKGKSKPLKLYSLKGRKNDKQNN